MLMVHQRNRVLYVRSVAMTAGSKFTHVSRNTVGKVLNLKFKKKKYSAVNTKQHFQPETIS